MRVVNALVLGFVMFASAMGAAARNIPKDLSNVRGFNYTAANVATSPRHHIDHWISYNPATTEFDLDLAKRLNLNQVRIFLAYQAYVQDKAGFREHLLHFVRACHQRDIGFMPVVTYSREIIADKASWPLAREWAADLVKTIGNEPGLAVWDVLNEPDWPRTPESWVRQRFEFAKHMAAVFHELDPRTPVTIGLAFVPGMEELADYVDVLEFHDYSPTRAQIRANIERAKQFAAKVGKPVVNGEIGCIARANPYDVTLQEHMKAGMGWYVWELMIVRKGWGPVHGVFYEDGTVRDPSIAAAILGFFLNRGPDILPSAPDREGWVTRVVTNSRKWLAQADASWAEGLDLAEEAANLLEAGQLIAMRDPPTRQVDLMRQGQPDLPALRALLAKYIEILEPYKLKQ
ncbi:MAG: hypothetical protein LAN62_18345 [Acidobacteriia bacterium]|nr:hypothetical protein [Terriglobia bacterium]